MTEPIGIRVRRIALMMTTKELADKAQVGVEDVIAFEDGMNIPEKVKVKILVALGGG